jgi:hypothetical protein
MLHVINVNTIKLLDEIQNSNCRVGAVKRMEIRSSRERKTERKEECMNERRREGNR